jgi:hypothetical protein
MWVHDAIIAGLTHSEFLRAHARCRDGERGGKRGACRVSRNCVKWHGKGGKLPGRKTHARSRAIERWGERRGGGG